MKNITKNKKQKFLLVAIASIILSSMLFLPINNIIECLNISKKTNSTSLEDKNVKYLAGNVSSDEMCKYLSDIEYKKDESKVEWGSITLDSNLENQYNNGLITLLVNKTKTYFLKGVSAHATSTLVYDISKYSYDYFSTYIGVDESRKDQGNGVKFTISTSTDGTNWTVKSTDAINSKVFKGDTDAELVTIELNGAKFIKLECNNNGNNASDHAVYADAKLYKKGYEETKPQNVDFIKTVEEYDKTLKGKNLINNPDNLKAEDELTLLQRTLVNNVGYDLLQAIVNQNKDYLDTVEWLMNDLDNLRLYVLGGEPDGGSYYNSIKELSRLYHAYSKDFEDKTLTNNKWQKNLTKGEVYKKMAISLSLTHATKTGYWAQIDHPSNTSDSVNRYKIYKELYDNGKFVVSDKQDHTPWYEALTVEEMRYIMNNITDDEELPWFNAYTQKRIDEHPGEEEKYLQPHTYIAYVWPDFENPIFHDPAKKDYWDDVFEGIFSEYKVTYSTPDDHVYKAWMSMRNEYGTGAVCGGISKLGCHIRAAHGTPATVVCQPGHAALIFYRKDENGKGYWSLDNDVSGWAQSGKSERMNTRMPLGWGSDEYVTGWAATYMMLCQEAINDWANYEKAEKIIMLADVYKDDKATQETLYRKALGIQKINIDAWWGLIKLYKETNRSQEDFLKLATDLGESLKAFPLPMKNLLDQISPVLTDVKYSFSYTVLETKLLNEGSTYGLNAEGKEDTSKKLDCMQPAITRTVAKYLLGQTDTNLANFSFDGPDAGKIVLSSKFDGNGVRWEYSLDGQKTWKEVNFEADKPHKWALQKDEIKKISVENDIAINIVGMPRTVENIYTIDIQEQKTISGVYANDLENRIVGVTPTTQWRYVNTDMTFGEWVSYGEREPDLTGEKYVQIRLGATGVFVEGTESEVYIFTPNNEPDTRKYVKVADMEIYSQNTQSEDSGRPYYAENIIDGNKDTMWHSNFKYDLTKDDVENAQIIIKLNRPRYISALEFIEKKYKNDDPTGIKSMTVSVSEDAENWTEAGKIENIAESKFGDTHVIDFADSVYGKYIKLDMTTYKMFASIALVNIFEDITKIDTSIPTASISYSTKEPTREYVIAKLVDPSTEITITNNDGNDTYVFKENGSFEFTFEDKNGNKGSALAEVDWIDNEGPSADVEYKLEGDKKLLILLDNISEDVYLLDENDQKINFVEVEDENISRISYLDSEGNVYKVVEYDADGNITKITYTNTTGSVPGVATFVSTYANGEIVEETYFDANGATVEVSDADKQTLKTLEDIKTNPLEYTFEESGDYQFKLLDKASNIAYKSIKVDYLEDGTIIASDITYDITETTNKDVVATINPYVISSDGEKMDATVTNHESNDRTFDKNGEFVFKYKNSSDDDDSNVKEHIARVDWIDKEAPTAEIEYSTKDITFRPVTATLANESEDIIITNNGMNREYTFTHNGSFTFEFEDKAGNVGTAIANVDWIDNELENLEEGAGDTNQDGTVTSSDVLLVKRHLVAGSKQDWILKDKQFESGDINKDGKITATDLLLIKRLVLEQMTEDNN